MESDGADIIAAAAAAVCRRVSGEERGESVAGESGGVGGREESPCLERERNKAMTTKLQP